MIEIQKSPEHLVAMRIEGPITGEDIEKTYKLVEERLAKHERLSFYAEVAESFSFTMEGLFKDLVQSVGQLGKLSRYYRAAVVTDKGWLGALARVEGLVFSSIDVRVFPLDEKDKAFAWSSEKPEPLPKPEVPARSVHFIQTNQPNVFAYEVNGKLREADIKAAAEEIKPYLERDGKINVLARMKDFRGFDLFAVLDDDLIKLKLRSRSKIDKYAVVGPSGWMRNFLELLSPVLSAEIRTFDVSEEAEAWKWVGAEQVLLAAGDR
jgi:hypothetical protein